MDWEWPSHSRPSTASTPAFTDRAVIDGIIKNLSVNKGGFKDLVCAVVLSEAFAKN